MSTAQLGDTPMAHPAINYHGRRFRKAGGGDGAVARYHQVGDLVWAHVAGGPVRRGSLNGLCGPDGTLRLAYTLVLVSGEIIAGHTVNTPQHTESGVLVLREQWERYGPAAATGVSYLEALDDAHLTIAETGAL